VSEDTDCDIDTFENRLIREDGWQAGHTEGFNTGFTVGKCFGIGMAVGALRDRGAHLDEAAGILLQLIQEDVSE